MAYNSLHSAGMTAMHYLLHQQNPDEFANVTRSNNPGGLRESSHPSGVAVRVGRGMLHRHNFCLQDGMFTVHTASRYTTSLTVVTENIELVLNV